MYIVKVLHENKGEKPHSALRPGEPDEMTSNAPAADNARPPPMMRIKLQ